MSLFQNCVCFPDNYSEELIDNIIHNITNINNSSNSYLNNMNSPLESIIIFGIIFLMIFVFYIISRILKKNKINPYSKNNNNYINRDISNNSDNISV